MNRTPRLSKSAIEYLDHVWNFASGCTKDCAYCWARKITCRFADRYPNGFEPTLYPEAFTSPLHLKKPSIVGCVFMGDLFDDEIDADYEHVLPGPAWDPLLRHTLKDWIFGTISKCPQHRFLFLTKQPQNLAKWSPFPDNCWVGITVTNRQMAEDACMAMAQIEATVKYISFEPLIEPVPCKHLVGLIDWAIIGARTKPYIEPKHEWVSDIVSAADDRLLPVFLKNSMKASLLKPDIMADHPNLLRTLDDHGIISVNVRQEMPTDG
ncbi:hypothetical protein LCGC14_1441320 [marine sediment metagenome]|uniref:Bacteriophage protein gp37 n=1 Tax=marine sediment metagenome TaxID=412755 RepID=A0A0F9JL82_9ZZZZ